MSVYYTLNTLNFTDIYTFNRGDMVTAQKGQVSATVWMDKKPVTVMSSSTHPGGVGEVLWMQKDGARSPVQRP